MNHIKIQINSKEALQRLLANDTEFEIEVRASVLHTYRAELEKEYKLAFEQKLRELLNQEDKRYIEELFKKEIVDQLRQSCPGWTDSKGNPLIDFAPDSKLKQQLEVATSRTLARKLDDYVEKLDKYITNFNEALPRRLDDRLNDVADKGIKHFEAILTNRVKALEDTNSLETKATAAAMKVIIEELNNVIKLIKKDTDESNTK